MVRLMLQKVWVTDNAVARRAWITALQGVSGLEEYDLGISRIFGQRVAVIEAYKRDTDRTLLRENLRKSPEERILALMQLQRLAEEARIHSHLLYLGCMNRTHMTVRVVPLSSPEASDARMGGTAEERLAAVAQLTTEAWRLSGRTFPSYTRATMPVLVTTLTDQGSNDALR